MFRSLLQTLAPVTSYVDTPASAATPREVLLQGQFWLRGPNGEVAHLGAAPAPGQELRLSGVGYEAVVVGDRRGRCRVRVSGPQAGEVSFIKLTPGEMARERARLQRPG
jgi:hypothetical protein